MAGPKASVDQLETELAALRASGLPSQGLIDALNTLASHPDVSPEQSITLSQEALDLAVALPYPRGKINALLNLSRAHNLRTRGEQALPLVVEALSLLATDPDEALEAWGRRELGAAYRFLGQYAEALQAFAAALSYYQQVDDTASEAYVLNLIGITYENLGQYTQAITLYQQALTFARSSGDHRLMAMLLNNLAFSTLRSGDVVQARALAEESVLICEQVRQTGVHVRGYAYALGTLVEVFCQLGELDEAERYIGLARVENRLPDGSLRYGDLESELLRNLARIYRMRGAHEQARATYEGALQFCIQMGLRHAYIQVLEDVVAFYEEQGETIQALQYLKQLAQVRAELFNENSQQRIRGLQVLHDVERTRREVTLLQQQNEEMVQAVSELEQTKRELQAALVEVQRRTVEQERLLAQNEEQRRTIRALNVPVMPLTEGILVMPLVGVLDDERLQHVQEQALLAVQQADADYLLLDITGVPLVDSQVAQGVVRTIRAAGMLGTRIFLIGIRPEVAQEIVGLGLDLRGVQTTATLQTALQQLGVLMIGRREAGGS